MRRPMFTIRRSPSRNIISDTFGTTLDLSGYFTISRSAQGLRAARAEIALVAAI